MSSMYLSYKVEALFYRFINTLNSGLRSLLSYMHIVPNIP